MTTLNPNPTVTLPVLVVDDQPEGRYLLRTLLGDHPGIMVVGEAACGQEALMLVPALAPAVVVLDVEMPGMHGFEAARRLMDAAPGLCVVMVSAFDDPQYAAVARTVGAAAFFSKRDFSADALMDLLERRRPRPYEPAWGDAADDTPGW